MLGFEQLKNIHFGKLAISLCMASQTIMTSAASADDDGLDIFDDIPGVNVPAPVKPAVVPKPSPATPAGPATSPGSGGAPGRKNPNAPKPSVTITQVEKSSFPEMVCPLVDNRPHADILQALGNLAKTVSPVKQCQDQPQAQQLSETLKDLMSAGEKVKAYWEQAQKSTPNADQLPAFQGQVEVIIRGMNTISELLSNNAFLDSDCGKSLLSGTGILSAVSDLSAAIVPIAMTVASINPSWSLPTNVILGLTGVGTVSNVLKSMRASKTIDMSEPQNRLALLQNTCEFLKVATRVRFIALAQSGQIEEVNKELNKLRTRAETQLSLLQTDGIKQILQVRTDLMKNITSAERTLKMDTNEITGLMEVASTSSAAMCQLGKQLVRQMSDANKLPLRSVRNFESLLKSQSGNSSSQNLMLTVEADAREEMAKASKSGNLNVCANGTKSYMDVMKQMLAITQKTVTIHKQSLQTQLSKDPDYRQYAMVEFNSKAELKTWEQVASILQKVNSDNGAIDRTEMDLQLKNLKRALFESTTSWMIWSNESPVSQWLSFINDLLTQTMISFRKEYQVLVRASGDLTPTRLDPMVLAAGSDPSGVVVVSPLAEQYAKDMRAAENLATLTPTVVVSGQPQHEMVCKALENTWIEYVTSLNNLSAQAAFCQAVKPLFDHNTDASIINHCRGDIRADGKVVKASVIQKRTSEIAKTLKVRADRVTAKMRDLVCPMPDAMKTLPYSSRM